MVKSLSEPSEKALVNLTPGSKQIMRVLHVDDDLGFLKTAKSCLEMHGQFEIDAASSVEDALKRLEESEYDAIISDYQMPSRDGLEFLKELRDQGNSIPFIVFTGKGREEVAIKALNLGADQYLDKHGDPETVYTELAHNIREAVEKRNTTQMLVESEEKYRNLVEDTKDSIVIVDLKGNVLFANKGTEELTGYTDGSSPINLRKVTPMKYWPKSFAMLLRARRGESIPYFESVIRRKDGRLVPVESGGKPLFRKGRVVGIQIISRDISTRKKEEREVLESERKYRELADQLPEIVFETDTHGRLTFLNEKAYEITGYTPEDFARGLIFFEFMAPNDLDRAKMDLKRLLRGEKIGTNEYSLKRKDGSTFPVLIRFNVAVRENKVVGCRGIVVDISERARMEQELRLFSSAVKLSSEGILVTDLNGRIIEANDAATRFYRANAKDDLVGKNALELVDPRERHWVLERRKEVTEKGFTHTHEYCAKAPSGSKLSIELTTTAMRDKEGKTYGFVSIIRDVTERKKREEKLKESEAKYRVLVERSLQGIGIVQGVSPSFVFVNPALARIFGYSTEELTSLSPLNLIHPDDRGFVSQRFRDHLEGKPTPARYGFRGIRKDGSIIWLEISASQIKWNGQPAVQTTLLDRTERREADDRLLKEKMKAESYLNIVGNAVVALDSDGKITLLNKKGHEILGYKEGELVGKDWFEKCLPEEKRDEIRKIFRELMQGKIEQHENEENLVLTKNGEKRTVNWHNCLLRDSNGKVAGTLSSGDDVTENKKMLEALRESEEKYRKLLESAGAGIGYYDTRGNILLLNKKAEDELKGSQENFIGRSAPEVFGQALGDLIVNRIREVVESKKVGSYEDFVKIPSGKKWFMSTYSGIRNDEGNIVGVQIISHDVTTRKQAEEGLRASEEKYHALADQSQLGVAVAQGKPPHLVYANPAMVRMSGYTPEELASVPLEKLIYLDDRDRFFTRLKERFERKNAVSPAEYRMMSKDGKIVWVELSSSFVDFNGQPAVQAAFIDITDRKKIEEDLKDSEAKYRELFETSIDGISTSDMEGHFLDCNEACQKMLGYSLDEMKKLTYQDLTPEKWRKIEAGIIEEQVKKKGYTIVYEKELVRKDGSVFPVSNRAWVTFDKDGIPKAMWGTVRDITERKKAEREIENLARFPSEDPSPVLRIAKDGIILYANAGAKSLLSELKAETGQRAPQPWRQLVADALDSGVRKEIETEHGERVSMFTFAPVTDAGYVNVYGFDITERKKVENELRQSEEKYRLVSENVPCMVYSVSVDDPMRVLFVSGKVEELAGYNAQQYLEDPRLWERSIHVGDKEIIGKKIIEHRKNKTPFCEEYRIVTRDGHVKWVKDVETSAFDADGNVTNFVGITLDITDLKNKESEIAVMNEKLRIVGGLTRHDVRNKLSVVVGNTYLARKARVGKDEIDYLQRIDEAVQQITAMLDFAKAYEILGSERLAYFDVEKAFRETTSAFSDLTAVNVISNCHGLSVRADSLLVELFHNLVDNSLKYGEKLTKIRVYYEEGADQLKLMYEDDGVGIPHEDKLKVFSEGFTTGKGSGHGLYLIRRMMEIYGWTIQETGETGKGVLFVITIPRTNSSGKENYRIV